LCSDPRSARKVSGSAYRITADRAYHHGTLLVSSDLTALERSITSPDFQRIATKATDSVRSKVLNLGALSGGLRPAHFSDVIEKEFRRRRAIDGDSVDVRELTAEDRKEVEALTSKAWIFGESPPFTTSFEDVLSFGPVLVQVSVRRGGQVDSIKLDTSDATQSLRLLEKQLRGLDFCGETLSAAIATFAAAGRFPRPNNALELAKLLRREIPVFDDFLSYRGKPQQKANWSVEPMEL